MKYDLPVKYKELHWSQRREVREQYIEEQKGLCYYCRKPLYEEPHKNRRINPHLFPKNFFKYPVHLHHCHKTGDTLGAVHSYCNAVLWQYFGE